MAVFRSTENGSKKNHENLLQIESTLVFRSLEEVQRAYGSIMGKINGLGLENQYVLVQEFLDGTEYVVDTVSLNGIHKV